MSALILPRKFKQQPQHNAPAAGNELTQGLVKLFTPASGLATPVGGITPIIGGDGVGFRATSSAAYYRAGSGRILSGLSQWTIVAAFATTQAVNSSGSALYCERAPTGGNILKLEGLGSNLPYLQMTVRDDAFNLVQFRGTSTVTNDGKFHIVAGVQYATNDRQLFVDGRLEASGNGTASTNFTNSSVESRIGSDAADAASLITGPIYFVGLYNTALSPAAIGAMWERRWNGLFKAPARRLWTASSGGPVTGTVSYINADDNSSAAGTTTVIGGVTYTNADDTTAASGSAGSGGATQFASDSFTDTDDVTLQAHDANWIKHPSGAGNDILITANRAQLRVTGEGFYYHSASPSSADYSVSIDLYVASLSPDFNATGVTGRTSPSANTFYHARYRVAGGWELYKRVAGTFTLLGSSTVSTPTAGNTYNLKLDMAGSTIRLLVDGAEIISVTDTEITAAGKAGLRVSNASAQTSVQGLHLDNFSAEEASSGSSVTGSVAYTNANDTVSAFGSPVIVGSLAVTNADDTASVSGSVGSAVTGSVAYTNADDTASATGTTTVIGSASITNADDTASASGTTTVVGSIAATNADDICSVSGTVESVDIVGTVAYTNADDTAAASGTTTILGSVAAANANDRASASGVVNNGIVVESALTTGIATTIRIKKPGIPANAPEWLRTLLEIVIGRRGNKITPPAFQDLSFSATPTKAECEALYSYVNDVRTAINDIIVRLDS